MMLNEAFTHCAVLGAAGKMGRGIAALVVQEMAQLELEKYSHTGSGKFSLVLVDTDFKTFSSLKTYLTTQLIKYAEKKIVGLRTAYLNQPSLTSNQEVIDAFIQGVFSQVLFTTHLEDAKHAYLVFEALPESIELKQKSLYELHRQAPHIQYYFSNTSSIPIYLLNIHNRLEGKVAGLHFYNPPTVQKLIEISFLTQSDPHLYALTKEIAERFQKTIVITKDFPGFISNGYFMREIAFASSLSERLLSIFEPAAAIYATEILTRDYLIRPMGIFQSADYVGLDICTHIASIMSQLLQEPSILSKPIVELYLKRIKGGLSSTYSQEPGFFSYNAQGAPTAVYSPSKDSYLDLQDPIFAKVHEQLGPLPKSHRSWKEWSKKKPSPEDLKGYLSELKNSSDLGCQMAWEYLRACNKIAKALLDAEIAQTASDINLVLTLGFHQLYGPIETWLEDLLYKE